MKNTKLFMFAACTLFLAACGKQTVKIMTPPEASNRVLFSAEQLQSTLDKAGYQVMMQQGDTTFSDPEIKTILLTEVNDTTLKKEGFHITTTGNLTRVSGRDGSGVIYGCRELIDRVNDSDGRLIFPEELKDHATSLYLECGHMVKRASVIASIMKCFEEDYRLFLETEDLSGLMETYMSMLVNRDRDVLVLDPSGTYKAKALGIDKNGELIVRREDGTSEHVYAGEVSVRGVYGYV